MFSSLFLRSDSIPHPFGRPGTVYEITLQDYSSRKTGVFVAKVVRMPARCTSVGDERKRLSYEVAEAPWSVAEWAVALRFDHPRATVPVLVLV